MSIKYNNKVIAGKYKEQVIPFANTVDAGIAKIATQEQINEGIDNTSIVTPVYLSQKQDKLTAGEGIDIDATNTISSTILPDKITIVENDNKTISTVARKTVNENIIYDWEGTQEEYQLALLNNEINPDWYCYITDDEQAVSYGDTLSRTLSNIAPEGEEVIKKLSKEAQGEEPSTGGGVGGGLPMFAHIWSDHIFNDVSYLRADNFSWHNGEIYITAYDILEQQYNNEKSVKETENGIIFKRTPDNFKIADVSQEDSIRALYETNGIAWYYIIDIENKRFKLPRTKYGFTGLRDKVGNDVEAGLPNIKGHIYNGIPTVDIDSTGLVTDGAFTETSYVSATMGYSTGTADKLYIGLNASLSNPIYKDGATVQPPATQQYLYFYVGAYKRPETEVNLGELINSKVDLDGENYKGSTLEEYVNNTCLNDKRTNCITEIPQRIKYTLVNGVLTVLAGSVMIVPYGTEDLTAQYPTGATFIHENFKVADTSWDGEKFFVLVETVKDLSPVAIGNNTRMIMLMYNGTISTSASQYVISGTTPSQSSTSYRWYDTTTNLIKEHDGTQWNTNTYLSFPFMVCQADGTNFTSVDEVFNGMGYIGSTFWVDKGVKALIPNGRNEDGSLKNIEVALNNCDVSNSPTSIGQQYLKLWLVDDKIGNNVQKRNYYEQDIDPIANASFTQYWLNTSANICYSSPFGETVWTEKPFVKLGIYEGDGTKVNYSVFNKPFRAVDYSDSSTVSGWGMPSNKYINLTFGASNTLYTAPANGWFAVNTWSTATATSYIHLYNTSNELAILLVPNQGTGYQQKCFIPAKKGDVVKLIYGNLDTSRSYFRFIYAEGEV